MIKFPTISTKSRYILSGLILLILALSPSLYFYRQNQITKARLKNPAESAKEETRDLVAKVGNLIVLPADEEPTVASVNDKDKLKSQPFFANSLNGDKVLLYMKAKKAILYRPQTNKIVEVAPLNLSPVASPSAQTSVYLTPTATPIRFILWNGTTIVGLTKKYQPELKSRVPAASIVDTDNAQKQELTKSIIVDISGKNSAQAQELAQILGLPISSLPDGETMPVGADYLIILGEDKK